MAIRPYRGIFPTVHSTAFVDPSAQILGDVVLGAESSVWLNTVIRGDVHAIRIGARTNVQDLSLVHVLKDRHSATLGDDVTVGHHVVLHGCRLDDRILVGMGAVVMDGVEIGCDCVVAAGALLPPGLRVPPGSLVVGSPARVKRAITEKEREWILESARNYVAYAKEYAAEMGLSRQE